MPDIFDQIHAQSSGGDVFDQIHAAATAGDTPGFFGRLSQQVLGTAHPLDQAVSEAKQLWNDPLGTLKETVTQPVTMARDLAYNLVTSPVKTIQDVTGGTRFAEDIQNKNYKGAAGTLMGAGTLAALATGAGGKVTRAAGDVTRDLSGGVVNRITSAAQEQYNAALAPTKQGTKFIAAKRTPEMLERGIKFSSADELAQTAGAKAATQTAALEDLYDSLPANRRSPTQPMVDALEQYKEQFKDRVPVSEEELRAQISQNKGTVPADVKKAPDGTLYRDIVLDPNAVNAAQSFQDIIKKYGNDISPQSMRKMRQVFDDAVARAGGYEGRSLAEGSTLDAQREAAKAIREQLAKDNPEIVPLNKEINFWLDVQKVARETAQRKVGQQGGLVVPLAEQAGRAGGAAAGAGIGGVKGAALGSYLGGKIMGKLASTVRSSAWRTTSAVIKNRLADALASGDWSSASTIMDSIGRTVPLSSLLSNGERQ